MIWLDNGNPLETMHDIVAAPAAHWWPLAPGWWVLTLLVLVVFISVSWLSWRAWQRRRPQRAALKQLKQSPADSLGQLNLQLKQAALGYFPRSQIGALQGALWWQFLAQQLPPRQQQQLAELLQQGPQLSYQKAPLTPQQLADYQRFALLWVQHALPPKPKRSAAPVQGGQHD
ncbi:MAG: DUF4381 domain-containing protein [Pseudidiomarina maritima]|nr:DUF4381 domain-containing protein [Pseudidiomarina maritima]